MRSVILALCLLASDAFAAATVHLLSTASLVTPRVASSVQGGCEVTGATTPWNFSFRTTSTSANSSDTSETMTPPNGRAVPCTFQTASESNYLWWITPPLSAGFTISETITAVCCSAESAGQLNAGCDMLVYKWDGRRGGITALIADTPTTTAELGNAGASCTRITIGNTTPTSTAVVVGDRLVILPRIQNVGTFQASGPRTATICFNGAAAGANRAVHDVQRDADVQRG